jgi:hypothetical protein
MSKKEILGFQPAPRLEQVGDNRPKQVNDGRHCSFTVRIQPG